MKLIEVEKVKRVMKDYWKAQVNKLPKPGNVRDHDDFVDRLNSYIEHNHELLKAVDELPSVEPEAISKWKKEFREYVDSLDITRDDWRGIIEYIDELPSAEPDTTTHDSIPAETGKNDGDGTSGDCISRQQAVDALRAMQTYKLFAGDDMLLIDQAEAQTELMMLPSVQPETNCSEIPNNSDTISRQQAVDFVGSMNMCDEISNEACKKLTSYLDELPSIQSERKTGRWLPDNTDYYRTRFICSACGESEEVPTTGFGYGTMWNYCPNCGAKMEGGEQE